MPLGPLDNIIIADLVTNEMFCNKRIKCSKTCSYQF